MATRITNQNPSSSKAKSKSKPKAPARQKLVKRACDPCKIRKIKCSEVSPCTGCIAAGVECTFNRHQGTRGPRTLRARTFDRIAQTRCDGESNGDSAEADEAGDVGDSSSVYLGQLLSIYAERLFPIWPIVDAHKLSDSLGLGVINEHEGDNAQTNNANTHLAHAVALATIAQLNLSTQWTVTVQQVERDAQDGDWDLIDSLRVSFFLHICYENQVAGGTKSLLYLREAITKAQLLRIDREATHASLPEPEQQLRRRILWLLFVTERGVAMLHKLPVVLRPNILRPSLVFPCYGGPSSDNGHHVLPSFLKLVHLFWTFDQSGIFELLRNADSDVSSMESLARGCLELLQRKLQDVSEGEREGDDEGNDVQRADMLVTRQWMRAVLWRAALRFGVVVPGMHPIDVAGEFLALVGQLPTTALESQGPTLEFKTYEIATAVVDAIANNMNSSNYHQHIGAPGRQENVLMGLYDILSSSRGGNKTLLGLLNSKMAAACPDLRLLPSPSDSTLIGTSNNQAIMSSSMSQQGDWDFITSAMGEAPSQFDLDQMAELAWPPLDLGNLLRSPSPLTRMLLEQHQNQQQQIQQQQQQQTQQDQSISQWDPNSAVGPMPIVSGPPTSV